MRALEPFRVTVTYCFNFEHAASIPTTPALPQRVEEFAEFCVEMTRRYAR